MRLLYGRRAAVDLIDLVRFPPAQPKPRWVQRTDIDAVLAQLTPGSKSRVRLELMHWTGMRPSQTGRLTRAEVHLQDPIPYVSVSRGKRGRLAAMPLVDEAVAAAHLHRERGVRRLVHAEREQGDPHGGPEGGPRTVHRVSDSPLVRDRAPARAGRPCGHLGLVRAHRPDDNEDLGRADARQAARRHPAPACRDRPVKTGPLGSRAPRPERTTIGTS